MPKGRVHGSTTQGASSETPSLWTRLSEIPRKLPFEWLVDITDCFPDERILGNGAFGVVYKGVLPSGEVVAVKRLINILDLQDVQFENEVNHLMMLAHKHIVRLLGYCHEIQVREHRGRHIRAVTAEKVLCYEYMPNGSLDNMIYDASLRPHWHTYSQIIMGICSGLHYLHEAHIIHLDLKPSNVLLDGRMQPKLADFGLSKLFGEDQSRRQTTTVVGTIGYMAPEYIHDGEITTKSDIYSLGVLILEIVTGEKNRSRDGSGLQYINNVRKNWKKSQLASRYPLLGNDRLKEVQGCVTLGLLCVQTNPLRRPTARQVIRMLTELKIDQVNYDNMLPARSLSITWSSDNRYWRWIRVQNSRYSRSAECAELLQVCWLHICGKIRTNTLCSAPCNAYLVYKLSNGRAYGLNKLAAEISIGGRVVSTHAACLESPSGARRRGVIYPVTRADGWMELKLGEVIVSTSGEDKELTLIVRNTDGSWKSGLIIQCMQIRRVD